MSWKSLDDRFREVEGNGRRATENGWRRVGAETCQYSSGSSHQGLLQRILRILRSSTSCSLVPTSRMSSFTTSKHFIFPLSYLLHVLLHHIQTLHLPSLLPPACPPSPHPNTSSSLAPTSCMSSFTTSKHFIFPHSYLPHVLLHHIQTLHLPSLLPPACPSSPHPNTSSSLAPTSCMSSFTTSKHFILSRSYLLHVLLHHIQTLHLPSLLPPACPSSPHPNTSSSPSSFCLQLHLQHLSAHAVLIICSSLIPRLIFWGFKDVWLFILPQNSPTVLSEIVIFWI